jgi:hypothetical protein
MIDETSLPGGESESFDPPPNDTPHVNVNITPVAVLEDRRKKKKAASTRGFDMRATGFGSKLRAIGCTSSRRHSG